MSGSAARARPQLLPLRKLAHLSMSRPADYGWVDQLVWQPIAYSELHLCAHYYPLAIRVVRGEPLIGVVLSRAYLIRPLTDSEGAWQSGYMPMAIRCFPFQATGASADPLDDLVVPPESPFFSAHGTMPFLDASGKASPFVEGVHALCRRLAESRRSLAVALDHLLIAGVLAPITREDGAEPASDLAMLTVDRDRIAQLSAQALAAMARHRFASVDVLIACLFSQGHLRQGCLPRRDEVRTPQRPPDTAPGRAFSLLPLPDVALDDGELLSFSDLEAALASLNRSEDAAERRIFSAPATRSPAGS